MEYTKEANDLLARIAARLGGGHHLSDPETADIARAFLAAQEKRVERGPSIAGKAVSLVTFGGNATFAPTPEPKERTAEGLLEVMVREGAMSITNHGRAERALALIRAEREIHEATDRTLNARMVALRETQQRVESLEHAQEIRVKELRATKERVERAIAVLRRCIDTMTPGHLEAHAQAIAILEGKS